MSVRFALACAVALALPVQALADPLVFKRTGKWILDYDKDACHLFAEFGDGALLARFSRYGPSDGFDLRLMGDAVRKKRSPEVTLDFGLGSKPKIRAIDGMSGKTPVLLLYGAALNEPKPGKSGEAAEISPADEARVTGLTIGKFGRSDLRLEFGSLGKPLQQMRACTDNLEKSWGYDPEVRATLSRKPAPAGDPRNWVTDNDYPLEALRKGLSGILRFRLDIDPTGAVSGCQILDRVADVAFSDYTCALFMKRAKFAPALDAQGRPVRSYYGSRISWVSPR